MININELKFDNRELIPAVIQHADTNEILMLGWMNAEALQLTMQNRLVHFWSRSREKLWLKGETSGNYLQLISIKTDCDMDTLLVKAFPQGNTCHTGSSTCFYKAIEVTNVK